MSDLSFLQRLCYAKDSAELDSIFEKIENDTHAALRSEAERQSLPQHNRETIEFNKIKMYYNMLKRSFEVK